MKILTENIIGYSTSAESDKTVQGINPATGQALPEKFAIATVKDVDEAMDRAIQAFHILKNTSAEQRAKFLEDIADEMEAFGDILVERASSETGLPAARIVGERGRTTGQLRMFAAYIREGSYLEPCIDTALPERNPVPKPDLRKYMVPLGPVVVFGASNFPLAYSVAGGDSAAAFAAGCPVIVKAHPGHPGTSALVGMAIQKAAEENGLPDGTFSLLYDSGFSIGKALVEHPNAAAIGFTGSTTGGRALFDIAAQRNNPIPVFAEMGSVNPSVLLPEALTSRADQVATNYAGSITLGAGQFCTNPGLILAIKGPELDKFINLLSLGIAAAQPATMLHSGISDTYRKKTADMSTQLGVEFVQVSENKANESQAMPVLAKASGANFLDNSKLHEEVFGPFSLIIECDSADQLLACVAQLEGQLTTTIVGDDADLKKFGQLISILHEKAGRVIFNGVPTGVEVCPSMIHGGPYPATTDSRFTAVGVHSIKRFLRPVAYQDAPQYLLPDALKDSNVLGIWRLVNGEQTKSDIKR